MESTAGSLSRNRPTLRSYKRMGHLKSMGLPELDTHTADRARTGGQGRAWIWLVAAALAIGGFWYYRSSHSKDTQNSASPPGPAAGRGGRGGANFTVPVVVATASKGDLAVYLNGLGTVTP